jgi:hypothetical protein
MSSSRKVAIAVLAALAAGAISYGVAGASPSSPNTPNSPQAARSRQAPAAVVMPAIRESVFTPVTNCRLAKFNVVNGTTRNLYVSGTANFPGQGGTTGGCKIPASATAISARISSTGAAGNGAVIAYPTGTPVGQGTLYYGKGVNVTTGATLQLGPGTAQRLTVKNVLGPAALAVDVNGYYAPQMGAYILGDGTLTFSSGRVLSSSHVSTGNYEVNFDRDVSKCSFTVTPYAFNYAVAVGPSNVTNLAAHVYIHDQGATTTAHDTSFFIQAMC